MGTSPSEALPLRCVADVEPAAEVADERANGDRLSWSSLYRGEEAQGVPSDLLRI